MNLDMHRTVADVLRERWNSRVPVDPFEIAAQEGLKVFRSGDIPYSGYITRQPDGSITVSINKDESLLRQRFTMAHELGHYVLGHLDTCDALPRDSAESFSLRNTDYREIAANRFAADLLMPAAAVRYFVEGGKRFTVQSLAEIFKVSEVAMLFRLKSLGFVRDR